MTIAYVNTGAVTSVGSVTSASVNLPASRTVGNLLIAYVSTSLSACTHTWPSGWTVLDHTNDGTYTTSIAWRIVDGTETSPTVTLSGSQYAQAKMWQYSGVIAAAIGSYSENVGTTSPHTCNEIVTTGQDSAIIYLDLCTSAGTLTTPSGYTSNDTSAPLQSYSIGIKQTTGTGVASGNISAVGGGEHYMLRIIELVQAIPIVPIDAAAESTSTASSDTIAVHGIAAPAVSTAAATTATGYIFAFGAFGSSSASLTSVAEKIFYSSGIASSSAVVTEMTSLILEANVIVEAIVSVVGAVIGTRNTSGSAGSSAIASDLIHGFFILDASVLSSGQFTSTANILRSLGAAASSAAVTSGNVNAKASYYLLAESIATIIDGVQFVNDYWDGWTYNLNIEAPSFYENFKFNSFAKLGRNYYGMASDGIHLLSGENDNGVDINSLIKTGSDDYDDSTIKTIPTIYASARSDREMILNAKVDDNPAYDYTFIGKPGEIAPIRVKLGRGLKGKMWQIEIRNKDGAFIEIDQLDIPSVSTSRKVQP